jgi:hydrogenase maturation factor
MCNSALHRVTVEDGPDTVLATDLYGRTRRVSLLAFDGDPPRPGTWVVVHSGYAIGSATAEEAADAVADLIRAGAIDGPVRTESEPKKAGAK